MGYGCGKGGGGCGKPKLIPLDSIRKANNIIGLLKAKGVGSTKVVKDTKEAVNTVTEK